MTRSSAWAPAFFAASLVCAGGPALAQGEAFFPGETEFATLSFEDLWPVQGDYDLNDVTLRVHTRRAENASGETTEVQYDLVVWAMGASQCNGVALRLPLDPGNLTIHRAVGEDPYGTSWMVTQLPAVDDGAGGTVIELSEDLRADLCDLPGFLNTVPGEAPVACDPLAILVRLTAASADLATVPDALDPGDIFLTRCGDAGHQTHRSQFGGVPDGDFEANNLLYGFGDDASDGPDGDQWYVDDASMPWALVLGDDVLDGVPAEHTRIDALFGDLPAFVLGGSVCPGPGCYWHQSQWTPGGSAFEFAPGAEPPLVIRSFECEEEDTGPPDCDGSCHFGDSPDGIDCDAACDYFDDLPGPDCDGACDDLDELWGPDCDGDCHLGDSAAGANCDGGCDFYDELPGPDCDMDCDDGDEIYGPDCDGDCHLGDSATGQNCDGACGFYDELPGPDCDTACDDSDEIYGPDCDGDCHLGDSATGENCDGECDYFDDLPSPDCDASCQLGDEQPGPDCDFLCDPLDGSASPDCNEACDAGEVAASVDCDEVCDVGEAASSSDCDEVCDVGEVASSGDCDEVCDVGELSASADCDEVCSLIDEVPASADCVCGDGVIDASEVCDSGSANGTNGVCSTACTPAVTSLVARASGTCALISGLTRCWGENGQLNTGDSAADSLAPYSQPTLTGVSEVAYGIHFSGARMGGSLKCWGSSNSAGTFGSGSATPATSASPIAVTGITTAVQLAVGDEHACALLGDGTVKCWGENRLGQLGRGAVGTGSNPTPALVTALSGVVELIANDHHTCARLGTGTVKCWGRNNNGQLGKGVASPACGGGGDNCEATPVTVTGITDAIGLAVGHDSACAIRSGATPVSCWGDNAFGELGTGATSGNEYSPVAATQLSGASKIVLGYRHGCLLTSGGAVKCWGERGVEGKLGDGSTTGSAFVPVTVSLSPASDVAVGFSHSCAALRDGTVRCWGQDTSGQMGNGVGGLNPQLVAGPVSGF